MNMKDEHVQRCSTLGYTNEGIFDIVEGFTSSFMYFNPIVTSTTAHP